MQSIAIADYLSEWLPNIANNKVDFIAAMQLLHSYSLVKGIQDLASYITYLVIYRWAFYIQDEE